MSRFDPAITERNTALPLFRNAAGAALLIVAASCQIGDSGGEPEASREWGPLAVSESGHGGRALIAGTVRITEQCVLLEEQGDETALLVWPSAQTNWDGEDMAVEFVSRSGQPTAFRDGDPAVFGGGASSETEGGQTIDEFLASVSWVSQPDRECVGDIRWFISDVEVEDVG